MRQRIEAILQTLRQVSGSSSPIPARIVVAESASAVRPALAEVERLTRDLGLHAAGLPHLRGRTGVRFAGPAPSAIRCLWRGLVSSSPRVCASRHSLRGEGEYQPRTSPSFDRPARTSTRAFDAIKGHLAAGDTYQVNFTFKMKGEFEGEPRALFADLD